MIKTIALKNLSKKYLTNDNLKVLNNINFSFFQGKIYSIVGPSGSGKSTLLNLLSLIDTPTSGVIEILNEKIDFKEKNRNDYIRSKNIGIIYQDKNLLTDFSALEIGSKDPHWGNEERVALKLCEDLFAFKTVRESTWEESIQCFDHKQVLDMVAAVGNYTMVSMMLNTFQVPLDSWLEKYEGFGVASAQK